MNDDVVGKLRAKVAAWRHGNPSRGLKIIAVAGAHGKSTTVLLLGEILQESGKSVFTLTNHGCFFNGTKMYEQYDHSAENVQRALAMAKKKSAGYIVLEVSDALVATQVLPTLLIEMTVITNDSVSAQALLREPVSYTVVPNGFNVAELTVAPHQAITFGEDESADAQIATVHELRKGTEIEMIIDHQTKLTIATYLVGRANALNVAAAVSGAYVLAADTSSFEEGIARLENVAGNYDYLRTDGSLYDVVVDAAHTKSSLDLILSSAKALKKRRLLIAADSTVPTELYDELKRLSDRTTVVTDGPDYPGIDKAATMQSALELMKRGAKKDDLLLLLGSDFAARDAENVTAAQKMTEQTSE